MMMMMTMMKVMTMMITVMMIIMRSMMNIIVLNRWMSFSASCREPRMRRKLSTR